MASKNGSKPATQAQLKAVRADLKTVEKSLKAEIQAVQSHLAKQIIDGEFRLDQKIESLDKKMDRGFNRITGTIDAFPGRLETYARESVTIPKTLDAHGEKLRDHEKRLTAVESK